MDWNPTEMQEAIAELAGQILRDDPASWDALVEAELLGVEDWLDACALLVEVGASGAHVPALETLALGWPLRSAGGERPEGAVLTAALVEDDSRDPARPTTVARDGRLTGRKVAVPAIDRAHRVVLTAREGEGVGVYAVDPRAAHVAPQVGTNHDALGILTLEDTPADRLGGAELLDPWMARVHTGVAALQLGLTRRAIALTASYVRERQQFGRAIGTFQAVSQRLADAWIDRQVMEVTLWQAAWRVQEGLPCAREVLVARVQAAEGSHRALAAAQHLHGGFGFDRDYPLHRYFLTSKLWEFILGGASAQLEALGDHVAAHGGLGADEGTPQTAGGEA